MRKWIAPLLLLAAVLLVVSLGFLPTLTGALQDGADKKTVHYHTLHNVAPTVPEESFGLNFLDKLQILQECEVSSIVPAMASMTEQQLHAAIEAELQPYADAGVIRLFEVQEFQAKPCVAISWQDAQEYFLFWTVSLVGAGSEDPCMLHLQVDDETGKLLAIAYYNPKPLAGQPAVEERRELLERFSQIWLDRTGLRECAQPTASDDAAQQIQGESWDQGKMSYMLSSGIERQLRVNFAFSGDDEYNMWIEIMHQ